MIYNNNSLKPNLNGELDDEGNIVWTNSKGENHRLNGPAIIYKNIPDGEDWFKNGLLHREDGPAINYNKETAVKFNEYWIEGIVVSKKEWIQWLKDGKSSLDQKTILRIILENS